MGDEDSQAELQTKFSMAQVMGFLLSLTAMHSFTIQEPDKDHHVMSKGGSAKAALWMLLFMLKSISVWMIGIGIKLALYDIEADADAFFAHDQKILLGFSCAACFLLTELMAPMHTATMKEYFHELLSNRVSVICFVLWMFNIAAMVGATYLHVSTLQTIAIQILPQANRSQFQHSIANYRYLMIIQNLKVFLQNTFHPIANQSTSV